MSAERAASDELEAIGGDHGGGRLGPRGETMARWMFDRLRHRPEVDMQFVFDATTQRLGLAGATAQMEEGAKDLRAFMDEHDGRFPRFKEYHSWRTASDAPPERRALKSASYIRKWFGGWDIAEALVTGGAHRAVLDPTARRLSAVGFAFEEDRLLRLLERWCSEQPGEARLIKPNFLAWLAERRQADEPGTRDVPLSWGPFSRTLGEWHEALSRAGYPGRGSTGAAGIGANTRFTPQRLKVILRAWAAEGGAQTPSAFLRWLGEQQQHPTCGLTEFPYSLRPFRDAFGTFLEMLDACGVPRRHVAGPGSMLLSIPGDLDARERCPTPSGELVGVDRDRFWVLHAAAVCGRRLSGPQYLAQRARWQDAATRHAEPDPDIPHTNTLKRRYGTPGGWPQVRLYFGLDAETASGPAQTFTDAELERFAGRLLHLMGGRWTHRFDAPLVATEQKRRAAAGCETRIPSYAGLVNRLGGGRATALHAAEAARKMGLTLDASPIPRLWDTDAEHQASTS
jgi:hypothetical protein